MTDNQVFDVILPNGDLARELWRFYGSIGEIRFESYRFQTKASARHRNWVTQSYYNNYDKRKNNIERPNVPTDVLSALKEQMVNKIGELQVVN